MNLYKNSLGYIIEIGISKSLNIELEVTNNVTLFCIEIFAI